MPIYEYHCNDCGKDFERLVLGDEEPDCILCASKQVTRLISRCGFITKGSSGETISSSASNSACSGCSATTCSTCSH